MSNSVLSTRWRSLWRSTGDVNLAVRIPEDPNDRNDDQVTEAFSRRDAFLRSAKAALDGSRLVTRLTLTLHLQAAREDTISKFLRGSWGRRPDVEGWEQRHDVVRVTAVKSLHGAQFDDLPRLREV
ncbi:hypothetical protein E2562_033644 [Oryza meyeriana var. granulata]|uniref:Uncharacterized protein n=1 Tax=Oryza meyeriana var. granulata TaxID=110450 RepID=A0A6G1CBA6_9ORYZ|nr:hypothetical protein E2562_033644 [Oryza meyeriana var. granulata]